MPSIHDIVAGALSLVKRLPLPVRRFLFDALQGVAVAIFALNIAIPGSLSEAKAQGLIVFAAIARAVLAAFARNLPDMTAYVKDIVNTALSAAKSFLLG
jgi:hypothetical protein